MTIITHALSFADEATAKAALPDYWLAYADENNQPQWTWKRDIVDGPIPTTHKTGNMVTDPDTGQQVPERVADTTYSLNIALPELHADLPGLIAAWDGVDAATGKAKLVYGSDPLTPQRVFG